MKFTADGRALGERLGVALAASNGRLNPVMGCVRCQGAGDALTLCGTDGEMAVTVSAKAAVEDEGECLLPPTLAEILKEAPPGDVSLNIGKTIIVNAGGDVFELPVESGQFLDRPEPQGEPVILSADVLCQAIDRTAFAAAKDEGKYAMRAVAWDAAHGCLVATDGKCLAVAELGVKGAGKTPYLLPPKAIDIARRLAEGEVKVYLGLNDAFFVTDAGTVYMRLVEGRYAPYRDVIPKAAVTTVTLDSAEFVKAVKLAALTSDDEARRVTCRFAPDGILMCAAGQPGRSAVRHVAKGFEGPPVEVHFDPKYLMPLSRLAAQLTLSIVDGQKSVVFRAEGVTYLVVPLV